MANYEETRVTDLFLRACPNGWFISSMDGFYAYNLVVLAFLTMRLGTEYPSNVKTTLTCL